MRKFSVCICTSNKRGEVPARAPFGYHYVRLGMDRHDQFYRGNDVPVRNHAYGSSIVIHRLRQRRA